MNIEIKRDGMINVNADNQIALSHYAFDKSWKDNPVRMAELLSLMNMKVENIGRYKNKLTTAKESGASKEAIEEIVNEIKKIKEKAKIVSDAKNEYWGYSQKIKEDEKIKHPRKYKTKLVEIKNINPEDITRNKELVVMYKNLKDKHVKSWIDHYDTIMKKLNDEISEIEKNIEEDNDKNAGVV